MSFKEIPPSEIAVQSRHRKPVASRVASLVESIAEIGLMHPVVVRRDGAGGYVLIAGAHRLKACEKSGWKTVPCNVVALDDLRAELAEIDENLEHEELTVLDRAKHVARRKEIHLALNPDATERSEKGGGRPKTSEGENPITVIGFEEETAAKSGRSAAGVRRDAKIGKGITDEVTELVKGTPIADSTSKLAELAPLAPKKQIARAKAMLREIAKAEAAKEKARKRAEAAEARERKGKGKGKAPKPPVDGAVDADFPAIQRGMKSAVKSISAVRKSLEKAGLIDSKGAVDVARVERFVRLGRPVLGRRHSLWTVSALGPVADAVAALWEAARVSYLGQKP